LLVTKTSLLWQNINDEDENKDKMLAYRRKVLGCLFTSSTFPAQPVYFTSIAPTITTELPGVMLEILDGCLLAT